VILIELKIVHLNTNDFMILNRAYLKSASKNYLKISIENDIHVCFFYTNLVNIRQELTQEQTCWGTPADTYTYEDDESLFTIF
jgi:hypothetical protein